MAESCYCVFYSFMRESCSQMHSSVKLVGMRAVYYVKLASIDCKLCISINYSYASIHSEEIRCGPQSEVPSCAAMIDVSGVNIDSMTLPDQRALDGALFRCLSHGGGLELSLVFPAIFTQFQLDSSFILQCTDSKVSGNVTLQSSDAIYYKARLTPEDILCQNPQSIRLAFPNSTLIAAVDNNTATESAPKQALLGLIWFVLCASAIVGLIVGIIRIYKCISDRRNEDSEYQEETDFTSTCTDHEAFATSFSLWSPRRRSQQSDLDELSVVQPRRYKRWKLFVPAPSSPPRDEVPQSLSSPDSDPAIFAEDTEFESFPLDQIPFSTAVRTGLVQLVPAVRHARPPIGQELVVSIVQSEKAMRMLLVPTDTDTTRSITLPINEM